MKTHAPQIWRDTRWVVQPKDYLNACLTGRFTADRWCAKGIAHLESGQAHPEYLALLGKDLSLCPAVLPPHAVQGQVTPQAASDWGLRVGTPVIVGWSDALAGILATGALHYERRGFVLAGTSEIIGLSRLPCEGAEGLYRVPAGILDLHGLELHYGPTQAGGACLEWLARLLGKTTEETLGLLPAPARPTSILFRPYLHGERTPYWDHQLTASLEGLRAEHGAPELAQAVLQGVALQERLVLECAERGLTANKVVLAGGAARDARWNRLRAEILQRPVLVMSDMESTLRGVALLAWAALGALDLKEPPAEWFAGEEILPDSSCAAFCAGLLTRFRAIPGRVEN
jgi:xylulokinase